MSHFCPRISWARIAVLGLLGVTAFTLLAYSPPDRRPPPPVYEEYLVAKLDVSRGEKITNLDTLFRVQEFAPGTAPPGAISKAAFDARPGEVLGKVVVTPLQKGEVITESHLREDHVTEKCAPVASVHSKPFNGPRARRIRSIYDAETTSSLDKAMDGDDPPRGPSPPGKAPQVWKRDAKRPTFARVYVGDGNSLELVSLQVTVTVEGPRARTLVDHIFHNPHGRQLEGTFEYPLPSGASPSYFAMFLGQTRDTVPPRFARRGDAPPLPADKFAQLPPEQLVLNVDREDWGALQQARVVGKEKALEVYEDTVRTRVDPALLEYAGGNTFSGRVFPIPPKGYNRVLIAYEELLPVSGDRALYRFPLPDCKLQEVQFALYASAVECRDATFRPDDAARQQGGGQLAFRKTWTEKGPGGEVVFAHTPANPAVQAISARAGGDGGPGHVYARVRPRLDAKEARPFSDRAVFLLDTSLSEHPDRFAVNMKLLRQILERDADIKHFNVLTFNVGAAWVENDG